MAATMTLKHLQKTPSGRWQYRRRFPEAVKATIGKAVFKMTLRSNPGDDVALMREYPKIAAEFERLVKEAEAEQNGWADLPPREVARKVRQQAAAMVAQMPLYGDEGGPEDDRRMIIAEDLHRRGANPALLRAVMLPDEPLPPPTLQDARWLYLKERLNGGEGAENREAKVRLDRVFTRVEEALGERSNVSLLEMTREDARRVRDHMLGSEKLGGGTLSPASVKREIANLKAVVTFAIKEFDLEGKAFNRFAGLEIAGGSGLKARVADRDKRLPLPGPVIAAMNNRLKGTLALIWRLLDGTGCRLAEITGLRVEDVRADHLRIDWHDERRLKTGSSIRSVPLVGDAQKAAQEALRLAGEGTYLFARYARERGPDAASAALMKNLRLVTTDKRHTVHSLRHGMKDKLRQAGVDKTTQDYILGHAAVDVGDRFYGSDEARLKVAREAMLKVFALGTSRET